MNTNTTPTATGSSSFRRWFFGAMIVMSVGTVVLAVVLVLGVASYFRLSAETRALRNGLIQASGAKWQQKIAFNVGGLTLGAARVGLSLAHLDDQARAALECVRGCEVGIYELPAAAETPDRAAMLKAADKAMSKRGWERVVGVRDEHALVAVYVSEKNTGPHRLNCRVMVFEGRQMVLVSAETKPQKLIECALRQPIAPAKTQWLAKAKQAGQLNAETQRTLSFAE